MRPSSVFLVFICICAAMLMSLLILHPYLVLEKHSNKLNANQQLVRELQLTDLSLFTEARYTRHLSQSDIHSAFQDYPAAMEYFPSGSMVNPPIDLWGKTP